MVWRWRYLFAVGGVVIVVATGVLFWVLNTGHAKNTPKSTAPQLTATAIAVSAKQIVQTYNQAAVKQDWATLYANTSQSIVSGYTQDEFTQLMAQQVQQVGAVSSIIPASQPVIKTNSDGTVYFLISEKVTMVKNGISTTQSVISVYLLEDDAWKFWFSK